MEAVPATTCPSPVTWIFILRSISRTSRRGAARDPCLKFTLCDALRFNTWRIGNHQASANSKKKPLAHHGDHTHGSC
eukprot:3666583-Prymnesium_polylepis.1